MFGIPDEFDELDDAELADEALDAELDDDAPDDELDEFPDEDDADDAEEDEDDASDPPCPLPPAPPEPLLLPLEKSSSASETHPTTDTKQPTAPKEIHVVSFMLTSSYPPHTDGSKRSSKRIFDALKRATLAS